MLVVAQWRDEVRVRNCQTSEDTASEHEPNGDSQVEPEARVFGRLGQVLIGECADDTAERQGLDQGCKGVEDADEEHVDAPGPRAIDAAHGARGADGRGHSEMQHLGAVGMDASRAERAMCSDDEGRRVAARK